MAYLSPLNMPLVAAVAVAAAAGRFSRPYTDGVCLQRQNFDRPSAAPPPRLIPMRIWMTSGVRRSLAICTPSDKSGSDLPRQYCESSTRTHASVLFTIVIFLRLHLYITVPPTKNNRNILVCFFKAFLLSDVAV